MTHTEVGDDGMDVGDPRRWSAPRGCCNWRCDFEGLVRIELEATCFKSIVVRDWRWLRKEASGDVTFSLLMIRPGVEMVTVTGTPLFSESL